MIRNSSIVQLPVSAAGLVTVLYCGKMILDLGLRAGDDSRDSSSMMLLLRGWFLGNSARRCSKEYRKRSSFWLDSLKRAWAWKERKRIRQRIKTDWKEIILLQQSRDPFHLKSKIAWSQKWQILTCCPVLHSLPLNVPSFLWLFQSPEVSWHSWLPRLPQPLSWHGDTAPPPADLKGWWWAFLEYKVTLKSFTLMTSDL